MLDSDVHSCHGGFSIYNSSVYLVLTLKRLVLCGGRKWRVCGLFVSRLGLTISSRFALICSL
jgi:hypothetical protein